MRLRIANPEAWLVPFCLALDVAQAASAPEVIGTKDLGPLETNPVISGRDGAYSVRSGGLTIWVYGDTALTAPGSDGGNWRHNTLSYSHDLWGADSVTGFSDWTDANGGPISFIPLTADELETNARHHGDQCVEPPCNYEFGFWPAALLNDSTRHRVYYGYSKMWLGPGAWNFSTVGSGFAVGSGIGMVTRPVVSPGSAEPTLLFTAPGPGFVNAALVTELGGVSYAYFFDCSGGDGFTKPMHLARVPLERLLERSAWRFFDGAGEWNPDLSSAAMIFDGADQLSVHWSPFLNQYLAVYVAPLTTNMMARVADRPEGPWSAPFLLFNTLPPSDGGLVYCGMAHIEHQRDDGRFELISYVRDTGTLKQERRLVEVEFARRINADVRDADYDPVHGVMLSDSANRNQICFGSDGVQWRQMALQFQLRLAPGARITSAQLQLFSSGRNIGAPTTTIRAIAQDDVAPFVAGAQPAFTAAYPLTAASVSWTPEAAPSGVTVSTPELRDLIQEVVDRPGWHPGNQIGLVFSEVRTGQNLRCFQDFSAGASHAALLRLGDYPRGTAVCLDISQGESQLMVARPGTAPCAVQPAGAMGEFIFGRVGALRSTAGGIDLGPVRCGADSATTAATIVRAADPDQPPDDAGFYLWRAAGAPDFGRARLPDGSTPPRLAGPSYCP